MFGCLAAPALYAAELGDRGAIAPSYSNIPLRALVEPRNASAPAANPRSVQFDSPLRESRFALAIGKAARRGIVERAVEGYTEVLIQCQNEKSIVLTTPFMRSDSQQAHCYRF